MTTFFQVMMRLREVSHEPLVYESLSLPVKMGNALPIAYGGFASSLAIQAAFHSLPGTSDADRAPWVIYSATGLFLGPTVLDRKVQFTVTTLRETRSFATRFIIASQDFDGVARKCLSVTVDFMQKKPDAGPFHSEPRLPLSYSVSPSRKYPPPEDVPEFAQSIAERIQSGELSPEIQKAFESTFGLNAKVSTTKPIPGAILGEALFGILRKRDTPAQLATPDVTLRRSADYVKAKDTLTPAPPGKGMQESLPLNAYALQASYLAFLIDGAIAFYPLVEHGLSLTDAAACSSLDFAIRYHEDEFDLYRDFHLREMRTYCASRERTFDEGLIWNQEGKLIGSVSQQCVLRPKPSKAKL